MDKKTIERLAVESGFPEAWITYTGTFSWEMFYKFAEAIEENVKQAGGNGKAEPASHQKTDDAAKWYEQEGGLEDGHC